MKNGKYILFTSGRGPVECAIAMYGIQEKFIKYLDSKNINYEIISQQNGKAIDSIETIVFKVVTVDNSLLEPWTGSIQWICQSPVRKNHKRKNWFIKCEEIIVPKQIETCTKDVTVQSYRAIGPGGQHRNKVETAIRLIHRSTGVIVTASDGKSQAQNKKKAWKKLIDKLELQNVQLMHKHNSDKWNTQIVIQRGLPVKTFTGLKFKN